MTTVYVLLIEANEQVNIGVHKTMEGARGELSAYARRWWQQEMGERPMPANTDQLAEEYFEVMRDRGESYILESAELKEF